MDFFALKQAGGRVLIGRCVRRATIRREKPTLPTTHLLTFKIQRVVSFSRKRQTLQAASLEKTVMRFENVLPLSISLSLSPNFPIRYFNQLFTKDPSLYLTHFCIPSTCYNTHTPIHSENIYTFQCCFLPFTSFLFRSLSLYLSHKVSLSLYRSLFYLRTKSLEDFLPPRSQSEVETHLLTYGTNFLPNIRRRDVSRPVAYNCDFDNYQSRIQLQAVKGSQCHRFKSHNFKNVIKCLL